MAMRAPPDRLCRLCPNPEPAMCTTRSGHRTSMKQTAQAKAIMSKSMKKASTGQGNKDESDEKMGRATGKKQTAMKKLAKLKARTSRKRIVNADKCRRCTFTTSCQKCGSCARCGWGNRTDIGSIVFWLPGKCKCGETVWHVRELTCKTARFASLASLSCRKLQEEFHDLPAEVFFQPR